MEGVEYETDRRVVRASHHFPGVAGIVDMAAQSQPFEPDAKSTLGSPLAKLAEIGGRAVYTAERLGRNIAADHEHVAADFLHQVELALGAVECTRALLVRHSLEITKRLKRDNLQA